MKAAALAVTSPLERCDSSFITRGVRDMSKGMDKKKETKKKAEKSLKEKRAAKQAKKASRG